MKYRILLVCTGNVCRSPMAAALLQAKAAEKGQKDLFVITSAGTWAQEGETASLTAQAIMRRRGLSLDGHRGRTITRMMLEQVDLVLVMTQHHRDSLAAEFPSARRKIHLFSELVGQQYDISDPYGGTPDEYESCAAELSSLVDRGYERIAEWLALTPDSESGT